MAKLPTSVESLQDKFGPHPAYVPPGGWVGRSEPDKLVKTHCCFCGMQCGIQLKVKGNSVVGFEPWEEFPFNRGKLCPKGVKRYMQGGHPDRLLDPMRRVEGVGFIPVSWDEAFSTTVSEIKRVQEKYGKNAVAVLSGVSLTNEKSYLMGKFARLGVNTQELDYNGRLCMVSAGAGNKKAFGLDRAANYWEDIVHAEVILLAGTNVAECSPITIDYIWRARDRGAKLIVIDPRVTPVARTCDLHLPVIPGAGRMWGQAKTSFLMHARGIEHSSKGVDNVVSCINLVLATGRIGRKGCGYGTITGQGNGQGGREHGHKCDQLPGNRDITNPEHRAHICQVWGCSDEELPGKGHTAPEIMEMIHRGEIKALISICFNPLVSLPDSNFTREALGKLEHYTAIDFFLNETAHHADIVLAGSLHEEEEGTSTSAEGRVIKINKAVNPPGNAKADTEIILELARRLGQGRFFDHFKKSEDIFNELRIASKGGTADYSGITYKRIVDEMGVFWPCYSEDHPGTPRLYKDLKFFTPDKKAHFNAVTYRPPMEEPDVEYSVVLTTGRVVSHYLSGTQTRRIGGLVDLCPNPYVEIHPQLAEQYGIQDKDWMRVASRRGEVTLQAKVVTTIRPDTIFIPYHWPGRKAANNLTLRSYDPVSGIPEYKCCSVNIGKAEEPK
ncbi:MAG: molybdopterin oxidoreductase family protein [Armatimonadetes bacterium]|nr:molybdopterin oxidoreductase family protein [Armatimonadota bacterium]